MAAPILLLHGLGGTHLFWEDVLPLLDGDVRAIDLPEGEVAAKAGTIATGLSEPHVVVGHSLGGMVAQELALARPDLVRAVVLANTIPGATERVIELNSATAAFAQQHGSARVAQQMTAGLFGPGDSARGKARLLRDMSGTPSRRLADDLHAICRFDARDRLAACTVPALVVGGEHEGNLPDQQLLADLLRTELVVLPGTGHMSPAEAPAAFVAEVARFLA